MTLTATQSGTVRGAAPSILSNPRLRGLFFQALTIVGVVLFILWIVSNTITNLERMHMASGFDFLDDRAGFDISQALIPYTPNSTYFRAFLVGLVNTLLVAGVGIFFAAILGFLIGVARLSPNWLLRKIGTVYVETLRNIPLLLQLFFWYQAVLGVLPDARQSHDLFLGFNLNRRGLFMPAPVSEPGLGYTGVAILLALVATFFMARWARRRQMDTGQQFPVLRYALLLIVGLPLLVFLATGRPLALEFPEFQRFNFRGGLHVSPELAALLLGLVLYTASFIAEIVRGGILAVSHGQTEASLSLGMRSAPTLRLVVIPQAMRVIIPPLTSQFLNLTKNSSLAVAIGYPDLVGVFKNTVLNQTGHAIEVIFMTMLVYLFLSLVTSLFMNWFNRKMALVER